jgi:hypothetical protein
MKFINRKSPFINLLRSMRNRVRSRFFYYRDFLKDVMCFVKGGLALRREGATPPVAYSAMRRLYCKSNGRFNDYVSAIIKVLHPPKKIKIGNSVLGKLSNRDLKSIAKSISEQGYHIFDAKLSESQTAAIVDFARSIPSQALRTGDDVKIGAYADELLPYPSHPVESPKYNIRREDMVQNETIQKLLVDDGILAVAQKYLGCTPILDLIAMWWSKPFQGKASTEAAQLYHFDMDRIKFIKFFFYLTDVTPETGPHCYVAGSRKRKPQQILRDGRISDDEIAKYYQKEQMLEICGKKGTILAVDTRGWHKGKALTEGERLLLQFEFANSMMGQVYDKIEVPENVDSNFLKHINNNRRTFQEINMVPSSPDKAAS